MFFQQTTGLTRVFFRFRLESARNVRFFFNLLFEASVLALASFAFALLTDVALLNLDLNSFTATVAPAKLLLRSPRLGSDVEGSEYEQHGTASKLSSSSIVLEVVCVNFFMGSAAVCKLGVLVKKFGSDVELNVDVTAVVEKHISNESTAEVYLIDVSPKQVINGSVVDSVRCGDTLIFLRGILDSLLVRESTFSAVLDVSPRILVFLTGFTSFLTNLLRFFRVNLGPAAVVLAMGATVVLATLLDVPGVQFSAV